jgi:hypothetical protein
MTFVCYRLVLTNASPTFQNLMNDILSDYIDKFVIVYLDDTLVSNRKAQHKQYVRLVLEKLQKAKFVVIREKCTFNKKKNLPLLALEFRRWYPPVRLKDSSSSNNGPDPQICRKFVSSSVLVSSIVDLYQVLLPWKPLSLI